jgi:hypothetical protein
MAKQIGPLGRIRKARAVWPLLFLALILSFALARPAFAVPSMPCQIYGIVTISGIPASSGVSVTASINGVRYAETQTDALGRYGYEPNYLRIPAGDPSATPAIKGGVEGDTVQISVNGATAAATTFVSGGVINLNLAVSAGQKTPSSPSQVSSGPASSPAPTVMLTTTPAPPIVTPAQSSAPSQSEFDIAKSNPTAVWTPEPASSPAPQKPASAAAPAPSGFGLTYPVIGGIAALLLVIVITLTYLLRRRPN